MLLLYRVPALQASQDARACRLRAWQRDDHVETRPALGERGHHVAFQRSRKYNLRSQRWNFRELVETDRGILGCQRRKGLFGVCGQHVLHWILRLPQWKLIPREHLHFQICQTRGIVWTA